MASILPLIVLVLMFGAFYFLLIRPQRKRQSEHRDFVESLKEGDAVITIGGIYGEVTSVSEYEVVIKVEDGSLLRLLKTSIMAMQQKFEEGEAEQDSII